MVEYTKVNVRLSDSQIKKLKDAVSNNTGTTLRISLKMFNGNNLLHELLLTTAAASAADAGIHKKVLGSGNTTLIISNEEMNDVIKIVQALEDSNILLKEVTETVKNETNKQKGGFLSMLLGTLGASLLGNLLTGKGVAKAGYGNQLKNKVDF